MLSFIFKSVGFFTLLLILSVSLTSCGNNGSGKSSSPKNTSINKAVIFGTVKDEAGKGIDAVPLQISIDRNNDGLFEQNENIYTTTNSEGFYSQQIDLSQNNTRSVTQQKFPIKVRITAIKSGYMTQQRVTYINNWASIIPLNLILQRGVKATIEGNKIYANVVLDNNSNTGEISIQLSTPLPDNSSATIAYVNPLNDTDSFPGDFSGFDTQSNDVMLSSTGVVRVEIRDQNGNIIEPNGNVTIKMPLPKNLWQNIEDADLSTEDKVEVPLWWYDNNLAKWIKDKNYGVLQYDNGTLVSQRDVAKLVYSPNEFNGRIWIVGNLPHLSTWNCDYSGPMNGISGKIKNAPKGSGVCVKNGGCSPVGNDGKFHVPVRSKNMNNPKDILDWIGKIAKNGSNKLEKPAEGGASSGLCPPLRQIRKRYVEYVKKRAKHTLIKLKDDLKNHPKYLDKVLWAYKGIDKANSLEKINNYLQTLRRDLPDAAIASSHGGDYWNYFVEKSGDAAISNVESIITDTGDLFVGLKETGIKSCLEIAKGFIPENPYQKPEHDIRTLKGIYKNLKALWGDYKEGSNLYNSKGNVWKYMDLGNRFNDWWKGAGKYLVSHKDSLIRCAKEVEQHLKDLPEGASKIKNFFTALKETSIIEEGAQAKSILNGAKVDGSGLLLTLLDTEWAMKKAQDDAKGKMMTFKWWKLLGETIHGNMMVASRITQRYKKQLERGEIDQDCYNKIKSLISSSTSETRGINRNIRSMGIRDIDNNSENFYGEIDNESQQFEPDSKAAAEFLKTLNHMFINVDLSMNNIIISKISTGQIERYNHWADGNQNSIKPPKNNWVGLRKTKLTLEWQGNVIYLDNSTLGVDPGNVNLPQATFKNLTPSEYQYSIDVGEFAVKNFHIFSGKVLIASIFDDGFEIRGEKGEYVSLYQDNTFQYFSPQLKAGDKLYFYYKGNKVGSYTLSNADIDNPPYKEILVESRVIPYNITINSKENDTKTVYISLDYIMFPKGEINFNPEEYIKHAKLISVKNFETSKELIKQPIELFDNNTPYKFTLPSYGIYLFTFETEDINGNIYKISKPYEAYGRTLQVGKIKLLTDMNNYQYGEPIKVKVEATDNASLPIEYSWSVKGENVSVLFDNASDIHNKEFEFTPVIYLKNKFSNPPTIIVSVLVNTKFDTVVKRLFITLPSVNVSPSINPAISVNYVNGDYYYDIELSANANGNPEVIDSNASIKSIKASLDGNAISEKDCTGSQTCYINTREKMAPGNHSIYMYIENTNGESTSKTFNFTVPKQISMTYSKNSSDDLKYNFSISTTDTNGNPIPGVKYSWCFKNNNCTDVSQNGTITYTFPRYGYYTVTSSVYLPGDIPITIPLLKTVPVLPNVLPMASTTEGNIPLSVHFGLGNNINMTDIKGFKWDPTGMKNPTDIPTTSNTEYDYTYGFTGVYMPVVYIVFNDDTILPVFLTETPIIATSPIELALKEETDETNPLKVHFTVDSDISFEQYSWDINGDGVIDVVTDSDNLTYEYNKSGNYDVQVSVNYAGKTYKAEKQISVGNMATIYFGNGLESIKYKPIYIFSTATPFKYLNTAFTDQNGKYKIVTPSVVGYLHQETDYYLYKMRYLDSSDNYTVIEPEALPCKTIITGLDDNTSAIDIEGTNISYIRAYPEDNITLVNYSDLAYKFNGKIYALYLVGVEKSICTQARMSTCIPKTNVDFYMLKDIEIDNSSRVIINLKTLNPIKMAQASVSTTNNNSNVYLRLTDAYIKIHGMKIQLPYFPEIGVFLIPVQPLYDSITCEFNIIDSDTTTSIGVVDKTYTYKEIEALYDNSTNTINFSINLGYQYLNIPIGYTLWERMLDGGYFIISRDGGIVPIVYDADNISRELYFKIDDNGSNNSWVLHYRPTELPDDISASDTMNMRIGDASATFDSSSGQINVSYTPYGNIKYCNVYIVPQYGEEPQFSVELLMEKIPSSITNINVDKFGSGKWFNDVLIDKLFSEIVCCDSNNQCVVNSNY